ncbi:hypothetical protein PM082_020377 [Marasmius tenuissimus]|nr:hypothetical protein PM082_020377 [Marasmius tenuissimus]
MPWLFDTDSSEALENYRRQMDEVRVLFERTPLKKRFKVPVPDLPFDINTQIELTKGIQTGMGYWNSQVWFAKPGNSRVHFVLKFFILSQCPIPETSRIHRYHDNHNYPDDQAKLEVAVYEKLLDF